MHIKRFEAATLEAALASVREELGPDALILSSRTIRRDRGAFGLLGKAVVEVQAAKERGAEERAPQPRVGARAAAPAESGGRGIDPERARFEREIRDELRALRAAVGRLEADRSGASRTALEPALANAEGTFLGRLEPSVATSLVEQWRRSVQDRPETTLEEVLRSRLEQRCAPPRAVDGKRVRLLVGAAGVGKTTSLAKLAARNEEGERDVVLVSLDDVRVGASEGLRRYAELLGASFHDLTGIDGMARLLNRRFKGEILVDTAGQSPDRPAGRTLAELRDRLGRRIEIDQVIDASARPSVQRAQLERFSGLAPDRVILTRRDELDDPLAIPNLLLDPACPPISWCGTGQRVPEDFEIVEPDRLARDVLGVAA